MPAPHRGSWSPPGWPVGNSLLWRVLRKVGKSVKSNAAKDTVNHAAEAAITRVLDAERAAREAVDSARLQVNPIAEDARAAARSVAERTERRVRAVVDAFERELAARRAEIDAEAARLDDPLPLTADELARLKQAVHALACELIGARP